MYLFNNTLITVESLFYIYLLSLAGRVIFKRIDIQFENLIERFSYGLITGYAIFAFTGFIFAALGFFYRIPLIIFVSLVLAASFNFLRSDFVYVKRLFAEHLIFKKVWNFFSNHAFLKIIFCLWLIADFVIIFAPIAGGDSLNYHLPIMNNIIEHGKITSPFQGFGDYGSLPALIELSYGIPTVIFNNTAAPFIFELLQYLSLILIIAIAVNFVKKRTTKIHWVFTAIGVLTIFDLLWVAMEGGYIDSFVALFIIANVLLTIESLERNFNKEKFYLGALFLGIALSAKYYALFILPADFAIIVISLYVLKFPFREILKLGLFYFLLALVICGYWYGENLINFGNPFYPIFSNNQFSRDVSAAASNHSLWSFLIFPIYVFAEKFYSVKGSAAKLIGSAYFLFLYCSCIFFVFNRKKTAFGLAVYILLLATAVYMFLIYFMSSDSRFMICASVFAVILSFIALDRMFQIAYELFGEKVWKITKTVLVLISVAFLVMFAENFKYFKERFFLATGLISADKYISDRIGKIYYMSLYLNEHLKNEKVAVIWLSDPSTALSAFYLSEGNVYANIYTKKEGMGQNSISGQHELDGVHLTLKKPENYFIISEKEKADMLAGNFEESDQLLAVENSSVKNSSLVYSYTEGDYTYKLYKIDKVRQ